ncbi:unnamed protein product [Pleuronectes platessa]|uniref:Uncharacterized protein n=1 Tax=Pleuronectes platessa TaxID=8262 RepID=A0A9N7Z522_PLEPL|nr:unnamed protein product [Pleuronectes platessa]
MYQKALSSTGLGLWALHESAATRVSQSLQWRSGNFTLEVGQQTPIQRRLSSTHGRSEAGGVPVSAARRMGEAAVSDGCSSSPSPGQYYTPSPTHPPHQSLPFRTPVCDH